MTKPDLNLVVDPFMSPFHVPKLSKRGATTEHGNSVEAQGFGHEPGGVGSASPVFSCGRTHVDWLGKASPRLRRTLGIRFGRAEAESVMHAVAASNELLPRRWRNYRQRATVHAKPTKSGQRQVYPTGLKIVSDGDHAPNGASVV